MLAITRFSLAGFSTKTRNAAAVAARPIWSFTRKSGAQIISSLPRHSTARRCELNDVFEELADRFHEVRLALNHLSDELLNLDDDGSARFSCERNAFQPNPATLRAHLCAGRDQPRRLPHRSSVAAVNSRKLAGASARELSELARTFLRTADDQLYVGIYYSRWLIEQLEAARSARWPNESKYSLRSSCSWRKSITRSMPRFSFAAGERRIASEDFARDLELQARVDTYLVLLLFLAFFRKTAARLAR